MTFDLAVTLAVLAGAVAMFISDRVPLGLAAVAAMTALMVTGVLDVREGLGGFADPAVITIAAMFMLSEGVRRTGALDLIGRLFVVLSRHGKYLALFAMMAVVGVVSAFVNNTAAVAIFIPVVMSVAAEMRLSPSKMLMPISIASMLGGTCTLIGTSTNILVSSLGRDHGLEPIGMFELAPVGIVFFVSGFAFMALVGVRLIPARRDPGRRRAANYGVNEYLCDLVFNENSKHLGETVDTSGLLADSDLELIAFFRGQRMLPQRGQGAALQAGDVLRVRGGVDELDRLLESGEVTLRASDRWSNDHFKHGEAVLVEAVVAPDSALDGLRIRQVNFPRRFGAVPVAIQHHGRLRHKDLGHIRLDGGDCLLLAMEEDRIEQVEQDRSFVLASQVAVKRYRRRKMPVAIAILAGVVAATAIGLAPIVVSAVVGVLLMAVTGCLRAEELFPAVNWEVILLLAGVIPLGVAMEKTGVAGMLASGVTAALGSLGPVAVLSGFLLLTMLLTEVMSNQAAAVLLVPVVMSAAAALGADPRPFVVAVALGASLSFLTPVGYQTNTLVYGPGQYKFTDYARVGVWLNLIFWVLGSVLIPLVWPL